MNFIHSVWDASDTSFSLGRRRRDVGMPIPTEPIESPSVCGSAALATLGDKASGGVLGRAGGAREDTCDTLVGCADRTSVSLAFEGRTSFARSETSSSDIGFCRSILSTAYYGHGLQRVALRCHVVSCVATLFDVATETDLPIDSLLCQYCCLRRLRLRPVRVPPAASPLRLPAHKKQAL